MINFNGKLGTSDTNLMAENRAFLYGDAVFETVKIVNNQILFLEDHYFRLMASMRVVRMEIPMHFTMEYLEEQIQILAQTNGVSQSGRARITVYRNDGGYYLPNTRSIGFLIHAVALENVAYLMEKKTYEVDLYKDFYVSKQLLSTIKTTNKMVNITGSIYANENGLDSCILLNEDKNVVEALQGNLFMLLNNTLITPPISEGCLQGIMRKQILALAKKEMQLEVVEKPISPFDLQKAEELFITNVIKGIQPITQYRKKTFETNISQMLLQKLNAALGF